MKINYIRILTSLALVPILVAIGLDGPWMVIPALLFLGAFSKRKNEDATPDSNDEGSRPPDPERSDKTGQGKHLGLILVGMFLASSFLSAADLSADETQEEGFLVLDVWMPFPGEPEVSNQRTMAGRITNYHFRPRDSHIRYGAGVYQDLPRVANPPASVMRGFTRGHRVRSRHEVEVNGIKGILMSTEADQPRRAIWNVFAFEYKGNVYLWMETFEPQYERGNEMKNIHENIRKIRTK